eukprot:3958770-Pyramimonas_sp.AAC.1
MSDSQLGRTAQRGAGQRASVARRCHLRCVQRRHFPLLEFTRLQTSPCLAVLHLFWLSWVHQVDSLGLQRWPMEAEPRIRS